MGTNNLGRETRNPVDCAPKIVGFILAQGDQITLAFPADSQIEVEEIETGFMKLGRTRRPIDVIHVAPRVLAGPSRTIARVPVRNQEDGMIATGYPPALQT
jgi:hypothetical protein